MDLEQARPADRFPVSDRYGTAVAADARSVRATRRRGMDVDLQRVFRSVQAVAEASQGDRPPREVLRRVCAVIAAELDFARVLIARIEEAPEGRIAVVVASAGLEPGAGRPRWPLRDARLLDEALAAHGLAFVGDARSDPALPDQAVRELGITSAFALPLSSEGRPIGFLGGDRGGERFELDATEIGLLTTIGSVAAAVMEKEILREELRRLDQAKTQFVALASHELRTPIQTVYGILATLHLRGGDLTDEQLVELRETAFGQALRLRRLTEQLLDLSKIDAAAITVAPEPTRVRRAVEEIVLLVAEHRAPEVEVQIASELEAPLDPTAFDRIVSNLVANALRYGRMPVRIAAEQSDRHLRVRVEDHGPGVSPEFVPQLFERFTRSENAARGGGSGLGLSIARAYARAHGGDLLYHDGEQGACFEIVLPIAR